ncbi:MAG TPA: long-chain fatty acid--CoA ligase [Bacteroidales bacterium]|jgi:long-chain acyl-CoA synthetase|nr:long-chain fatty acid--CoA ligase [Bacteroidales bacterium]
MIEQNFIKLYEENFQKNWELPALTDYKGDNSYTYGELAGEIAKLHLLFRELGIQKGDAIALIGRNHSSWAIVFLAAITYGAVIVPILHEFNPESMVNIIVHSDSKLLFVHEDQWKWIDADKVHVPVIDIPTFSLLQWKDEETLLAFDRWEQKFRETYPTGFTKEDIRYADVSNDEVVCLNYTSGTTGFSKGVMITANNFAGNVTYAHQLELLFTGDRLLAFLPMAHVYGCAFDFLYSLSAGVHVTLLGMIPTPRNLLNAMQEVRPHLIITVPLIFEKIYKSRILPTLNKPLMKGLMRIPGVEQIILNRINKKLIHTLGGRFRQVIIGGAALNAEVEACFYKMRFPFTVGYGMTECAPLISYDHHHEFIPTSCGSVLKGIMEARIDSPDPENVPGEIQVRGENVMKGYYKNPKATKEAFTEDGWLKTGDSGVMKGRRLFIKGRIKTMILSANGQNVYPEEIESRLNNLPYVGESLVVQRNNSLVALVYPEVNAIASEGITPWELEEIMAENRNTLNQSVALYERISDIVIVEKEFEKTPKKSIKRFLYT